MSEPDLSTFERRVAERRAREAEQKRQKEGPQEQFDDDLIPDQVYERSATDVEMDRIISTIAPAEAYNRWIGKMRAVITKPDGNKISCPIPGHIDPPKGPGTKGYNAWMKDDGRWHCAKCEEGGDIYDLAAIHYGVWASGTNKPYKQGAEFHKLREKMAKDFGFRVIESPTGVKMLAPVAQAEEEPEPELAEPPKLADVVNIIDDDHDEIELPSLDWRPVVPEDTFLYEYMKACVVDDVPEEYHFFHGLVALGFALGRDATLFDSVPVYGNLFVCTLGRSGVGKSKAKRHLDNLLAAALPYDKSTIPSKGVARVSAPGSAEALVHSFMEPVEDPTNPKRVAYYAPVRGLIDFNELSALVGRTNRQGSVLKPTLMQFYDMESTIQTSSMTTGRKIAEEPFASCLTTSQPLALKGLLDASDDASGFLNRWVFVPGKEKKRYSVGGRQVDITPAIDPLKRIVGWSSGFSAHDQIEWSPQAFIAWDKFFQDTLEPMRQRERHSHMLVRIDLTLKKLMLLFAANRHEKVLSEQSVLDALYCFPYLKAAYGVPEAQIGNTLNNEISEVLIYQINKYSEKGGISMSKLWDNIKHRKYDRKRVLDILTTLTKMGLVEEINVNAGKVGRPSVKYRNAG